MANRDLLDGIVLRLRLTDEFEGKRWISLLARTKFGPGQESKACHDSWPEGHPMFEMLMDYAVKAQVCLDA